MENIISIEKYNPKWPKLFQNEATHIAHTLFAPLLNNQQSEFSKIHHIGSTAIPGISAKPIIDILIECADIFKIKLIEESFLNLNYDLLSNNVIPNYTFFTKKYLNEIGYHVHIMERGDPQIKRHIHFRDYLIHHRVQADAYAKLKTELAKQFVSDRTAYTFGKNDFIRSIDQKAKIWPERERQFLPPNTYFHVQERSEKQILNAIEANITIHMTHFEQYLPTVTFTRKPQYTAILNESIPDENFNYILNPYLHEENADSIINDVTHEFNKKRLPFCWWLFPSQKNLASYLENHGFENTHHNIGMYFDLEKWNAVLPNMDNFYIKRATDQKTLLDFAFVLSNDSHILDSYFEQISKLMTDEDPQEYYVGYLNDEPITCGLICFYGRVAGLHCLTTSSRFRKQGYGTAMQLLRLKRAKDQGYQTAVLQASESGYSLYLKLGWKPLGKFLEFKNLRV